MSKTVIDFSVSLDGYITGPEPGSGQPLGRGGMQLFHWYTSGGDACRREGPFAPEGVNARVVDDMMAQAGAVVSGRNLWEIANGWGGTHPANAAAIVLLTHQPPVKVPRGASEFHVVTTGIEEAVRVARQAARGRGVGIAGAAVARQALRAGLVDEIYLHVVPCVLGGGTRLFDGDPLDLEKVESFDGPHVTHLRYRVRRPAGRLVA